MSLESLEDRCTPAATISVGDVSIVEANDGTRNAVVQVSVSEPHSNSVSVNYSTADGAAKAGSDYIAVSGKLTFAKNEMSKPIQIPIRGDRLPEPNNESFFVRLSDAKSGARIADGEGVVTILDDEARVSIDDAYMTEGHTD